MKNITYKVEQDEMASAPDEWGNDDCFLVYDHRDFTVKVAGYDPEQIFDHLQETKENKYENYFVFPVYAYIHSGVALSLGRNSYPFTCNFDTSLRGFALINSEEWKTPEEAEKVAQLVVNEWNDYLSGNVWFYKVEVDGTVTDSCGGFYGNEGRKDAEQEALAIIAAIQKQELKAHLNKVKNWIKSKTPFHYRKPLILIP